MLYAYGVVAAIIMALCIAVGYQHTQIGKLEAQLVAVKAQDAEATARFLLDAQKKDRENADRIAQIEKTSQDMQAATARDAAAVRSRNSQLQHAIDAYSASGHDCKLPETSGSTSGSDGRTATVGHLLEGCLEVAAECAGGAESLANQVRGLQAVVGK